MTLAADSLRRLRAAVAGRDGAEQDELAKLQARLADVETQNQRLRERNAAIREEKKSLRRQLRTGAGSTSAVAEVPGRTRLELRRDCVFASVPRDASVLEIGPAHNAILPKREGFNTRTVDYLDRAGLVQRYRDFPQYSPEDIEEVDYVLAPGAAMADVIEDRFDLVLASHVIEHTTSMIDFVNESTRLLKPAGVLALVVPDHRYCFDRFRERASLSRVIDASLAPPQVHTVGAVVEERLNAVRHRGATAWAPGHRGLYSPVNDLDTVKRYAEEARRADRYIDTHNWICTPHHLRLLLQDLYELGLIALRETFFHDTVRHEFFLNLSRDGAGSGLDRESLLVLSDGERRSLDVAEFESS